VATRHFVRGSVELQASAVTAWQDILSDLEKQVSPDRFHCWFKNTVGISCGEGRFEVGVPSAFTADWFEKHYRDMIKSALESRAGHALEVTFTVDPELFRGQRDEENRVKTDLIDEAAPEPHAPRDASRYTLDNFVVGPCNSVAYHAALKVAQQPGKAYNPLFIHGGVGLGKTHLLRGITHALKSFKGNGGIEYVSAEAFMNRFIFALNNRAMDAFHRRYRKASLLVIDDIHFLANKRVTQDEFLNTYKALSHCGSQIVMASDSHPKLIGKLKQELVTRFLSGMVVRLEKPGYPIRLEIVRRKCAERKLALPAATEEFVARNVTGSVRELEGAINTLAAWGSITGSHVTLGTARTALAGLLQSQCRPVRLPEIDDAATRYAGLAEGDLAGGRRSRPVSQARHLAMYLARDLGHFSYSEIGAHFGGRNHSTVVSAVRKIAAQVEADREFAREVAALKAEFGL
jgi:chromosomal replication initiator protein